MEICNCLLWLYVSAATKQLYEWFSPPVRPYVLPSVFHIFFHYVPIIASSWNFRRYYQWQKWWQCKGHGQRSKVKVTDVKTQLNRSRTVTPVGIHVWWCNDTQRLMLLRRGALLFSRSSVKFQGHLTKISSILTQNWAFPDCNFSLNSPMVMKWCTKLDVAYNRCPIVFHGHPSNFKVTRLRKLSMLTQIGRFRTVTPVWIHQWLWNDAPRLK